MFSFSTLSHPKISRPGPVSTAKLVWTGTAIFVITSALLYLLNTSHGIGILPDSTRYMRVSPQPFDAPMYAWCLDLFAAIGIDRAVGAKFLGLVLICANSLLVWHTLIRGTGQLSYAAGGTAFTVISPQFVAEHSVAMSEPLFLCTIFGTVLIFVKFLESKQRFWLAICGATLAIAMLVRFSAAPLGAAILVCLLLDSSRLFQERVRDAVVLTALSFSIFLAWVIVSEITTGHATGRALQLYGNPDAKRWMTGLRALTSLLLPTQVPKIVRIVVLTTVVGGGAWLGLQYARLVLSRAAENKVADDMIGIVYGLFFVFYIIFMLIAVYVEANLPLHGRYALPFYVAFAMMVTIALSKVSPTMIAGRFLKQIFIAVVGVLFLSHVVRIADRTRDNYVNGIGYASVEWVSSPIVRAVKDLPEKSTIFTNGPDALNYLTAQETLFIPFVTQRRTGLENPKNPLSRQIEELRVQLARPNSYVVFLDKVDWRFYLISEENLKQALNLQLYQQPGDGRIYQAR